MSWQLHLLCKLEFQSSSFLLPRHSLSMLFVWFAIMMEVLFSIFHSNWEDHWLRQKTYMKWLYSQYQCLCWSRIQLMSRRLESTIANQPAWGIRYVECLFWSYLSVILNQEWCRFLRKWTWWRETNSFSHWVTYSSSIWGRLKRMLLCFWRCWSRQWAGWGWSWTPIQQGTKFQNNPSTRTHLQSQTWTLSYTVDSRPKGAHRLWL